MARGSEIRSGLFVVLAILVFTILLFAVGNLKAYFQSTVQYHAYLPDARFLRPNDPVAYGGIRVGEIKDIEIASDRFGMVKLTVSVRSDVPVGQDSVLVVKQEGMLGPKYVEIKPGSPQAGPAAPGAELKALVPPTLGDLSASFEGPLAKLERILDHLNTLLGAPDTRKNIEQILSDASVLLKALLEEAREVSDAVVKTSEKAQQLVDEASSVLKDNRPQVDSVLRNLDEVSRKLIETSNQLDEFLKNADDIVVENNRNLFETIRATRDTAYHLERAAKLIRSDPSVLLFGAQETPEDLRRADETQLRLKGRARRYDKENP